MNTGEATQAVLERGFHYLDTPRIVLMLNNAKDTFEDLYAWPWLMVANAGPTPLDVPDLKLILNVNCGGNELLGLTVQQVLQDGTSPARGGTPEYWWVEGDHTLHAWPGDGASVSVNYIIDSPPLVDPADTPLIPARYHPLWIDLAVCDAYADSDNFSGAQLLRAYVMTRMQDVIARYETRNRQHSPFVTVRGFSEDD